MRVTYFADILLPLPLEATFTYRVPQELEGRVAFGVRVIVPFGRSKLYSGLVVHVHTEAPQEWATKYIVEHDLGKVLILFGSGWPTITSARWAR